MSIKSTFTVLSMLAAGAIVGTTADSAEAANLTCTATNVAWATSSGGTMQVYCGGAWYYAFVNTSGTCSGVGLESAKVWTSFAQSALLAGKSLVINYTTTTAGNCISYVRLNN